MRYSVRANDPGFKNYVSGHLANKQCRPVVRLDGEVISRVFTADEDRGEIQRFKTDANGALVRNAAGDDIETETLLGVVRVVWEPERGAL